MPLNERFERRCDYLAKLISGMGGILVINPFDVIKTKQQHLDIGFKDGAYTIKRLEGVRGFFHGVTLPLALHGVMCSMFFTMYSQVLSFLNAARFRNGYCDSENCDVNTEDPEFISKTVPHNIGKIAEASKTNRCNTVDCLIAGAVAGVFQLTVACPVEVVKVRQQAYGSIVGGPITCLTNVYNVKGIKGLYKGFTPMAVRNVGGGMIQTFTYKLLKEYSESKTFSEQSTGKKLFDIWLAAGFAGMLSWWVVTPLDVIKTKLQADEYMSPRYKGPVSCAKKIWAGHGPAGLFRGVLTLSLPGFAINGAVYAIYSWTSMFCKYSTESGAFSS